MAAEETVVFNRISIIGLGLMGGSLGMALRRKGLAGEVSGYDLDPLTGEEALRRGAVDRIVADLAQAAAADLVVLAVPVSKMKAVMAVLAESLAAGTLVTDLGSVKEAVLEKAACSLPPGIGFIGGHPMVGSERGGIGAADPFLFQGVPYILVPAQGTGVQDVKKLRLVLAALGANPMVMDSEVHDRLVAVISHLPHLAAVMLVDGAVDLEGALPETFSLVGGGFRDTTRVAAGDPGLWRDILEANRGAILAGLDFWQAETTALRHLFMSEAWDDLERKLALAKGARDRVSQRPGWQPLAELVAVIEDRPGSLGEVCLALGEAGVNIADLRLLRIERGTGGTLWLGFGTAVERDRAAAVLTAKGYRLLEGNG